MAQKSGTKSFHKHKPCRQRQTASSAVPVQERTSGTHTIASADQQSNDDTLRGIGSQFFDSSFPLDQITAADPIKSSPKTICPYHRLVLDSLFEPECLGRDLATE